MTDLKVNDGTVIQSLTKIAGIGIEKANEIVNIIINNDNAEGLLKLYLMDSIIKNVGGSYVDLFSKVLLESFSKVFRTADPPCRKKMFTLRHTWNANVSASTLYSLDIVINGIDANWPVMQNPTSKQNIVVLENVSLGTIVSSIHFKPFYKKYQKMMNGSKCP